MPKVLRIINRFNLGGPTFNAAYLTKYIDEKYETMLVGGVKDDSEDDSEFILERLGLKPRYVQNMKRSVNFFDDRKAYKEILDLIDTFKPDIVHTHASKAGALGRKAAFKLKVPVTVHTFHGHVFHSYFGKLKTSIYKNLERNLAKKTTKIVAISALQKQELSSIHKICGPEKIEVIPLGFDLSRFTMDMDHKRKTFRDKYQIQDNEILVSIIGRLAPIKNHRFFLDVVRKISDISEVPVRFMIVGDGETKPELIETCRDLNIDYTLNAPGATVNFTSWIKDTESVYAGSDIICLSSLNEGTPVTLIEAQASNKPIISTDVGGIRDICIEGETALLSPSGELDAYVANMLKLIHNPEMRQKMSAGRDHVLDQFGYKRLAEDMSRLYDALLHQL